MAKGGGLSFHPEDLEMIDELRRLLKELGHLFTAPSRAEAVRIAVRDVLEAKRSKWAQENPEAARLRRPPGKS